MTKSIRRPKTLTVFAAILCISALSDLARGQTLARPGWVGSGLTYQSWSKHAVIYEIDTRSFEDTNGDGVGDLKGITRRLDYIKALGVDAILLEPLAAGGTSSPVPIDPVLGTLEDFDELSIEASRHNLRVLLDLPAPDAALARFWLTRGVAGFHVPASMSAPAVQPIRRLLPTFVGQRILITDADSGAAAVKLAANELVLDSTILKTPTQAGANTTSELRAALDQSQTLLRSGNTVLETDALGVARSNDRFAGSGSPKDTAKVLAAALLLNRSVAVIYAGQELGLSSPSGTAVMMPWGKAAAPVVAEESAAPAPPKPAPPDPDKFLVPDRYVPYVPPVKPVAPPKPLPPDPATAAGQDVLQDSTLNFYRELVRLHHGASAVRDGEQITLNHDDVNALIFVRRPPVPSLQTPAIFVVCNLSDKPLNLSLKADVTNLRLRGSFLRKLLRSDDKEGSMYLDPISLPGFGVYVGELRY